MHTVEHADRFVVMLPNGTSMDVAKDGLSPAMLSELRGSTLPGMADGGDDTDAKIKALEAEIDALAQASEPDAGYADYKARVDAADAGEVRDARYGVGDDRDAGTLAEGLGSLGVAPVPTPGQLPGGMPVEAPSADLNAVQQWIGNTGQTPVAPIESVEPVYEYRDENGIRRIAPRLGFGDLQRAEGERTPAPQERLGFGDLQRMEASRTPSAAAETPEQTDGLDPELVRRYKEALARVQNVPQIGGIGRQKMEPFVRPKEMVDAAKAAQEAELERGYVEAKSAQERAALMEYQEKQRLDLDAKLEAERADEYRRQQELFADVFSGKIDPNRMWGRMDTGQRALALVGLVLGGLGAGNTGVNATVGVFDRMIDRDVDAQAKDLDRKRTLYGEYLRMGYQREQARQMTKASLLQTHAAQLDRMAAQNGSPKAMAAAAAASAQMRMQAENWFQQAQDAHAGRQLQAMGLEQQRQIANMQARQSARNAELQARATMFKAMNDPKIEALKHTLPDGRVIVASTPESKSRIEKAQSEHETFLRGLQMLKELRAKNPGGNILPAWMSFMGFDSAEQSKIGDDLAAAVRLSYLKAQGAGAYDKGSGELSKQIISSPADYFTGDDATFYSQMDKLANLANTDFYATVTAGARGGEVFRPPTVRVVGKAE